ncbi:coiled-coil domain-containing protein 177-like [Oryctolagus cuniculus]|uniref:coiled-coil domain-containing protein 177-like n=1 Tax=Oryctolagus cuniculus TaxID=9986 RepID=UPI003879E3AF
MYWVPHLFPFVFIILVNYWKMAVPAKRKLNINLEEDFYYHFPCRERTRRKAGAEGHEVGLGRALAAAHPLPPPLRARPAPHRARAHQRRLPRPARALRRRRPAPQRRPHHQREHQQAAHGADGHDQGRVHVQQRRRAARRRRHARHARHSRRRRRPRGRRRRRLPAVHQRQQHRGRGRQRGLAVVLHQHQQPLARQVRLVQAARRADLARVQPHAERQARAARRRPIRRRLQLVGQPRVVAGVRVHRAHLRHHVARARRPRHPHRHRLARRPARAPRQHPRRVVVLVQHEHLQRHVAAQRRHARVARAHLEAQQLQLLAVQRLQRVHAPALRVHRHVARQQALAHAPLHQRVRHARVLPRVRVARRHRHQVAARRVVLPHEHRVLGLRERGRVVVHVRHLHPHAGRRPQRRRARVARRHHHAVARHKLAVQPAVQHQRVVVPEGRQQPEGHVRRQGAAHLPVGARVAVGHADEGDHRAYGGVLSDGQ